MDFGTGIIIRLYSFPNLRSIHWITQGILYFSGWATTFHKTIKTFQGQAYKYLRYLNRTFEASAWWWRTPGNHIYLSARLLLFIDLSDGLVHWDTFRLFRPYSSALRAGSSGLLFIFPRWKWSQVIWATCFKQWLSSPIGSNETNNDWIIKPLAIRQTLDHMPSLRHLHPNLLTTSSFCLIRIQSWRSISPSEAAWKLRFSSDALLVTPALNKQYARRALLSCLLRTYNNGDTGIIVMLTIVKLGKVQNKCSVNQVWF